MRFRFFIPITNNSLYYASTSAKKALPSRAPRCNTVRHAVKKGANNFARKIAVTQSTRYIDDGKKAVKCRNPRCLVIGKWLQNIASPGGQYLQPFDPFFAVNFGNSTGRICLIFQHVFPADQWQIITIMASIHWSSKFHFVFFSQSAIFQKYIHIMIKDHNTRLNWMVQVTVVNSFIFNDYIIFKKTRPNLTI